LNVLKRVKTIFLDSYDCFNGQHRSAAFAKFMEEHETHHDRETKLNILVGYEEEIERQIAIACGHNTNQNVTKVTVDNKSGYFEKMKQALGGLSSCVEWVQNSMANNKSSICYKPAEIIKLILAVSTDKLLESSLNVEKDYAKNCDRYEHGFAVLPSLLKAYEIIVFESEDCLRQRNLMDDTESMKRMFDGRSSGSKKTAKTTGTLGPKTVYTLTTQMALVCLNSFKHLFKTVDGELKLTISETEFLTYVRACLPELLMKIALRDRRLTDSRAYIRAKHLETDEPIASTVLGRLNRRCWKTYRTDPTLLQYHAFETPVVLTPSSPEVFN